MPFCLSVCLLNTRRSECDGAQKGRKDRREREREAQTTLMAEVAVCSMCTALSMVSVQTLRGYSSSRPRMPRGN
jgi:hypothetical protein